MDVCAYGCMCILFKEYLYITFLRSNMVDPEAYTTFVDGLWFKNERIIYG